jgi:hypothetical protein
MRLGVQHKGDLREMLGKESQALAGQVTDAVSRAGQSTQRTLRGETSQALGTGIANAWRLKLYPRDAGRGDPVSANASAYVYTKAPKVIDAFDRGAVIRARNVKWLAIPLEAAGKTRGSGGRSQVGAGKALTPLLWQQRRGIKLRFVPILGGSKALLVAEGVSLGKTGRIFKRKRAGRPGEVSVPVFLLVRSVKAPKLLNVESHADGGLAVLATELDRRLRAA